MDVSNEFPDREIPHNTNIVFIIISIFIPPPLGAKVPQISFSSETDAENELSDL